ncbi:hypothetical protein ACFWPU_00775 [Streptomyces sp. NPDC058471]|uniref:hypothetical protein n=1 Tax=Streptomyces sp. NPDC058471 TaxID=3346516 RepID=UPI0036652A0F
MWGELREAVGGINGGCDCDDCYDQVEAVVKKIVAFEVSKIRADLTAIAQLVDQTRAHAQAVGGDL